MWWEADPSNPKEQQAALPICKTFYIWRIGKWSEGLAAFLTNGFPQPKNAGTTYILKCKIP